MPSFNKAIKRTTLIELLIIILCFYSVYMVASFYGFNVDMEWMYVAIIAYILIKSRKYSAETNQNIFSKIEFRYVFLIVIVNVFFSYGGHILLRRESVCTAVTPCNFFNMYIAHNLG